MEFVHLSSIPFRRDSLSNLPERLWIELFDTARSARRSSVSIRRDLGEDLAAYKLILAKTGRDGKWTGFLETIGIPRTTADRYIRDWERETSPKQAIRTTGAIDGPSKEDISGLVKNLTSQAKRILTTDDSVAQFLLEISAALQPSVSAT